MCLRHDTVVISSNVLVEVEVARNFNLIMELFLARWGVLCNRLFKITHFHLGSSVLFALRLNESVEYFKPRPKLQHTYKQTLWHKTERVDI